MTRLLVVDGDPRSLRVLDVSLRRAGYDVDTATTGAAALAALEAGAPDLVVADTQLAEIDGFELGARMRQNPLWSRIPLIFLASDPTLANKIRGFQIGADDYLIKPAYVKEVVGRVRGLLRRQERVHLAAGGEGEERFEGDLGEIGVVDLIEILEANGRSGVVQLQGPGGAPGGLYFRQGKVVDAEVGRLSGADALFRLMSWDQGRFEILFRSIRRKDVIERASGQLVVEGMERLDEWNRLLQQLPAREVVFEVDYRQLAERLAEIPDEVNGILRLFDGTRTVRQVVEDSGFADMEALGVVTRLYAEGIVYDAATRLVEGARSTSPGLGGWLSDVSSPFRSVLMSDGAPEGLRASAPVARQSFAERLEVEGQGLPAPPVEPTILPPRRRTEPGFGLTRPDDHGATASPAVPSPPIEAPTPAEDAVPVPREEADNLIRFPAEGWVSSEAVSSSGRHPADYAVAGEIAPADAKAASAAVAQRGAWDARAPDPRAADRPSLDLRMDHDALGPPPGLPDEALAPELPDEALAPELPDEALAPPPELPDEALAPPPSERTGLSADAAYDGESNLDEEISKKEALAELGLSASRTRRIGMWGAGVAVGTLAAVLVFRVASAPEPAPAAPAPASPERPPVVAAAKPSPPAIPTAPVISPPPAAPGAAAAAANVEARNDRVPVAAPAPAVAAAAGAAAEPAPPVELPAAGPVGSAKVPDTAVDGSGGEAARMMRDCRTAFTRGKMRGALAACTAASDADPGSAEALAMLAHTQLNLGRSQLALELAQRAIDIDPKQSDAYVIVGGVLQDGGRNKEAKAAYRRYLELAPRGRYAEELRAIVGSL